MYMSVFTAITMVSPIYTHMLYSVAVYTVHAYLVIRMYYIRHFTLNYMHASMYIPAFTIDVPTNDWYCTSYLSICILNFTVLVFVYELLTKYGF